MNKMLTFGDFAAFSHPDTDRHGLTGPWVTQIRGQLWLCATDGHVAVMAQVPNTLDPLLREIGGIDRTIDVEATKKYSTFPPAAALALLKAKDFEGAHPPSIQFLLDQSIDDAKANKVSDLVELAKVLKPWGKFGGHKKPSIDFYLNGKVRFTHEWQSEQSQFEPRIRAHGLVLDDEEDDCVCAEVVPGVFHVNDRPPGLPLEADSCNYQVVYFRQTIDFVAKAAALYQGLDTPTVQVARINLSSMLIFADEHARFRAIVVGVRECGETFGAQVCRLFPDNLLKREYAAPTPASPTGHTYVAKTGRRYDFPTTIASRIALRYDFEMTPRHENGEPKIEIGALHTVVQYERKPHMLLFRNQVADALKEVLFNAMLDTAGVELVDKCRSDDETERWKPWCGYAVAHEQAAAFVEVLRAAARDIRTLDRPDHWKNEVIGKLHSVVRKLGAS